MTAYILTWNQRASSVTRDTVTQDIQMNISMVDQLPQGFSGAIVPPGIAIPSHATVEVVQVSEHQTTDMYRKISEYVTFQAHFHEQELISPVRCNGTCSTTVQGPGVAVMGCRNRTWPINETSLRDTSITW